MLEFNKLERKIAERLGNFAVTPCVGVWIEIAWKVTHEENEKRSLPVWECGLKLSNETVIQGYSRHSLCGSVD